MSTIITSVGKTGIATRKSFDNVQKAENMYDHLITLDHIVSVQITFEDGIIYVWVKNKSVSCYYPKDFK